jgi:pyruvate,water dikinase
MGEPSIVWLDDEEARRPSLVGNKAAVLAQLRQRGYEVPYGFCITTAADLVLTEQLRADIGSALGELMPPWVVRSSATAEDSKAYAFPGLFRTVLDLADVQSAYEAIAVVRRSAGSPSVARYAAHHGIDLSDFRMAVLIQSLLPATVAGVAFSRDPVTGGPGVVIESNYGLGETVVDGSVTPDSLTVSADGTVGQRRLGSKRAKVVVTTHGTRIRRLETSALERGAWSLGDEAARSVATTVRRLEADIRSPVDVEWAIVGDRLYILQSRPITTLSPDQVDPPMATKPSA